MLKSILHNLVTRPLVYDIWQKFTGSEQVIKELRRQMAPGNAQTVLEVGAGTGNNLSALPPSVKYIWGDNDPTKLAGFRSKYPGELAVLADATPLILQTSALIRRCAWPFCVTSLPTH
jgi:hypothetical protein